MGCYISFLSAKLTEVTPVKREFTFLLFSCASIYQQVYYVIINYCKNLEGFGSYRQIDPNVIEQLFELDKIIVRKWSQRIIVIKENTFKR